MKNFFAPGTVIEVKATAPIVSGDIVAVGELVGIAAANYAVDDIAVIDITGVYKLTKRAGAVWTQGQKVYKTTATQVVREDGTGGVFMGYAYYAQPDSASTVGYVLLARPGA